MAATVRFLVRDGRVTPMCRRCGERLRVSTSSHTTVTCCGCGTTRERSTIHGRPVSA